MTQVTPDLKMAEEWASSLTLQKHCLCDGAENAARTILWLLAERQRLTTGTLSDRMAAISMTSHSETTKEPTAACLPECYRRADWSGGECVAIHYHVPGCPNAPQAKQETAAADECHLCPCPAFVERRKPTPAEEETHPQAPYPPDPSPAKETETVEPSDYAGPTCACPRSHEGIHSALCSQRIQTDPSPAKPSGDECVCDGEGKCDFCELERFDRLTDDEKLYETRGPDALYATTAALREENKRLKAEVGVLQRRWNECVIGAGIVGERDILKAENERLKAEIKRKTYCEYCDEEATEWMCDKHDSRSDLRAQLAASAARVEQLEEMHGQTVSYARELESSKAASAATIARLEDLIVGLRGPNHPQAMREITHQAEIIAANRPKGETS